MITYNLGEIPDWIQAITGIVATIFLLMAFRAQHVTLKLQQKTSDDQKELLRLEMEKDRRNIMPGLKVNKYEPKDMGKYEIFFTMDNNSALDVTFIPTDKDGQATFSTSQINYMNPGFEVICYFEMTNWVLHERKEVFTATFSDVDGRNYSQTLYKHFEEVYFHPPIYLR